MHFVCARSLLVRISPLCVQGAVRRDLLYFWDISFFFWCHVLKDMFDMFLPFFAIFSQSFCLLLLSTVVMDSFCCQRRAQTTWNDGTVNLPVSDGCWSTGQTLTDVGRVAKAKECQGQEALLIHTSHYWFRLITVLVLPVLETIRRLVAEEVTANAKCQQCDVQLHLVALCTETVWEFLFSVLLCRFCFAIWIFQCLFIFLVFFLNHIHSVVSCLCLSVFCSLFPSAASTDGADTLFPGVKWTQALALALCVDESCLDRCHGPRVDVDVTNWSLWMREAWGHHYLGWQCTLHIFALFVSSRDAEKKWKKDQTCAQLHGAIAGE